MDPDGTGYIHTSEAANLIRNLIKKKCELFSPKQKILLYDSNLLGEFIQKMNLKLYKNFQSYNFYDILIALSQAYILHVVSSEKNHKSEFN